MEKEQKKSMIPAFFGIAAVWFGTHVGPGTASGKQVTVYYNTYGKLGLFTPIAAMGLLGLAIYYALEYSRKNHLYDFKSFTNKFFHPYEKIFSIFFEISFLGAALLSPGVCIATSVQLFNQHFGMNIWIGTIIIVALVIIMTMYGSELVKTVSTGLTVGILITLSIIAVLGIRAGAAAFSQNWTASSFNDVPATAAVWSAITYCGFQASGNLGAVISVADGINSKKDSFKAAMTGFVLNTLLLIVIAIMNYGFQPESLNELIPNYYIITQLGIPVLRIIYVILVVFAALSTIIGFVNAVIQRFGKFVKIEDEKKRNFLIIAVMLFLDVMVSTLGIAAIINVGFRYLGLLSVPFVVIPFIYVGFKKSKKEIAD